MPSGHSSHHQPCPDLHDLFGLAFENRYKEYEVMTQTGEIKTSNVSKRKICGGNALDAVRNRPSLITFKDACNLRSPQQHAGVVHSSNLCTEITLNTSVDEIAVCNLGSVNLRQHVTKDRGLDREKLAKTVKTAVRMLDNVIGINYYAVPQAETQT